MDKKPFDFNSGEYIREEWIDEKGQKYYLWRRITPFTSVEKSIIRNKDKEFKKNAIKVNINSNDSPEQVSEKTKKALEKARN